jgi:hypothetical protein
LGRWGRECCSSPSSGCWELPPSLISPRPDVGFGGSWPSTEKVEQRGGDQLLT